MEHTIYHRLMAVQVQFPNLRWDIEDGLLVIHAFVTQEEAKNLLDARRMFTPIEDADDYRQLSMLD